MSHSSVTETPLPPDTTLDRSTIRQQTARIVAEMPVIDMHTHLFAPQFGDLGRSGIDDLLTYHYLIVELLRSHTIRPQQLRALPIPAQADLVWDTLFVRNTPLSEAARGVVCVLSTLGVDPSAKDLRPARAFFRDVRPEQHVGWVLDRARVRFVVMTNDPFDAREAHVWSQRLPIDPRFRAALRIDTLLNDWEAARHMLDPMAGAAAASLDADAIGRARQFLDTWIQRMDPLYLAVSLPDDFAWPDETHRSRMIRDVVLPACREHGLPFAMMIGVRRAVNPALQDGGDALGRADVSAIHRLCAAHPENRFLVTMLSRENQHELCVAARKFSNLMPFGCWWFLNNPSIVADITRERLELLGATFIAQHSDARILEQLLYKWPHARRDVAEALADQYVRLIDDGRGVTVADVARDARLLFVDNFARWSDF